MRDSSIIRYFIRADWDPERRCWVTGNREAFNAFHYEGAHNQKACRAPAAKMGDPLPITRYDALHIVNHWNRQMALPAIPHYPSFYVLEH